MTKTVEKGFLPLGAASDFPPSSRLGERRRPDTEAKPTAADEEIDMPSLITGSSGLLGRCLVERLEERGDELRLLDLIPPPAELAERHATYCADVSDEDTLREASRGA